MYLSLKKNMTRGSVVSDVQSSNLQLNVRTRRHPTNILIFYSRLLWLVGICPTERSGERKLLKFTGMISFHLFWGLITTKAILTYMFFKKSLLDVLAFIVVEYFLCFILWWIVFWKRFHIFTTIQCLASSCASVGLTPDRWIHALFILLNMTCFFLSTFNRVEDHGSALRELRTFLEDAPQLAKALDSITDAAGFVILHGLPFSVALLYIACCLQAHLLIFKSLKVSRGNQSVDTRSFETCSSVVERLEDGLSLAMFVFVLRSLVEFVCTLTAVINFLVGVFHQIYVAFFLQIGALYCLILFAADSVQSRHADFKKYLLKKIARRDERDKNLVAFLEVQAEDVSLTAWKMFYLDRRLLLSTVASLLTYGIILYQLK